MTTDNWVGGTGNNQSFDVGTNWSTGSVPNSSDDTVISTSSATTVYTGTEDVKSIALGSEDTLVIGYVTVQNGTGSGVNAGTIDIGDGFHLYLDGGTFDSDGTIEMTGSSTVSADIVVDADTELNGSGSIAMQGGPTGLNQIAGEAEGGGFYTALFSSEDISGSGIIGGALDFINNGTVETGSGRMQIYGTAAGGEFVNNATLKADNGGQLIFGYAAPTTTINNSGIIELDSTGSTTQLQIYENVTIEPVNSGNQIIDMVGSLPGADQIVSAGSPASLTLINETLKGAGTVGDSNLTLTNGSNSVINANNSASVLFLNTGNNTITNVSTATIEADGGNLGIFSPVDNAGTISAISGGGLAINSAVDNTGTIAALNGGTVTVNTSITNNATMQVGNGGEMTLGNDSTTTIYNNATIELNSTGTATKLEIDGNVTIEPSAGNGNGTITLGEGGDNTNSIASFGNPATLTLSNETLQGYSGVGDSDLTLDVESGATIDADDPADTLELFTGNNTITNAGLLEATNNGILYLPCPIDNTGTIAAVDGTVEVNSLTGITGSGTIQIGAGGEFYLPTSVAGNVDFIAASGELLLNDSLPNGGIGGVISGAVAGDTIFLEHVDFSQGDHAVWDQTSASGGTLSIYDQGSDVYTLDLAGTYNSLDFAVTNGGEEATLITVQNTPSYPENGSNNDEWILSDGNWVASADPGPHPADYNVVLTGDWTGDGTDGILWFDPTTGDADEWQLSNTQWSTSVDLGPHPANGTDGASYQIAGTDDATDFTGNGIDDVLWTSPNSDGKVATDIWELGSNGQWVNSVSPGNHPAGYSVAGGGDWTGDGTDGILWYNSSTGDTDEWQLSGGQWANSVDLGSHPGSGWSIAGVGDFFGNGIDDVLWTNASGGSVQTDIWELGSSGQWINSVSPGNHPAGYQVVGVGDFTGTGTSDILWYNASTGDADEWLIDNGQWADSVDLGPHPGNFQIAGVGDFNGAGNASILWHASS